MDRQHFASRQVWYPEITRGSDTGITVGHIAPLADESSVVATSDPFEIPLWMGRGLLNDVKRRGKRVTGGSVPLYQDFEFMPWFYYRFFTSSGYLRPGAGTNTDHDFFIPPTGFPATGTFQIQDEMLEGTPVYTRHREVVPTGFSWSGAEVGPPRWMADVMGIGELPASTDLAGTKTDNGIPNFSYNDASLVYEVSGTRHTISRDITGFSCNIANGGSRREAFFRAAAGSINTGKINGNGELAFAIQSGGTGPMADLNFYSDAENERVVFLDMFQYDKPAAVATKFRRDRIAILIYPRTNRIGGARNPNLGQPWSFANPTDASWRAEYIAKIAGPYAVVTGVNDKLGFKRDGGATTTVTLPAGATGQQTVDACNAAVAGSAYLLAEQWPVLVSATKGGSSSIQIDTAVANTCHTLFGFDGTARAGRANCPYWGTFRNSRNSDYAVA